MTEIQRLRALLKETREAVQEALPYDGTTHVTLAVSSDWLDRIDAALSVPEVDWSRAFNSLDYFAHLGGCSLRVRCAVGGSVFRWNVDRTTVFQEGYETSLEAAQEAAIKAAQGG